MVIKSICFFLATKENDDFWKHENKNKKQEEKGKDFQQQADRRYGSISTLPRLQCHFLPLNTRTPAFTLLQPRTKLEEITGNVKKKQKLKQLPLLSRASLHGNVLRVAKKEITENNRPFAWKKNHQTIRSTTTTHWIYFSFLFQRKANKTPVVVQGNAALVSRIAKSDTETCVTRPKSTGELTWCAGSPEMLPPMTLWYWWMAEAPPPYSTTGTVEPIRRQFHQFR